MSEPVEKRPIIVCVDDDILVLRSLREQLQRGLGTTCAIELAASAHEGLQLLNDLTAESADVPLLISDQIMPGMKGAQFLASAHQSYPAMFKIMLSGHVSVEAVSMAVNEGGLYRVLTKPWDEAELVSSAREALRCAELEKARHLQTTDLQASYRQLKQSVQLLHATMNATLDGILVLDQQGAITQANPQLLELWGMPAALAIPGPAGALVEHMQAQLSNQSEFAIDLLSGPEAAVSLELANGRFVEYLSRPHTIDDQRVGTVYSFRDITERQRTVALIRHQAQHDPLTGLANRHRFGEALSDGIRDAKQAGRQLAVMFLDLDEFKRINDTLGHAAGDELLCLVAQRLRHCVREHDLIARWGGDEFTILLPVIHLEDEATAVAERILQSLMAPLHLGASTVHVGVSIGIAVYPDDSDDQSFLLMRADLALYQAKKNGRNSFQSFRRTA